MNVLEAIRGWWRHPATRTKAPSLLECARRLDMPLLIEGLEAAHQRLEAGEDVAQNTERRDAIRQVLIERERSHEIHGPYA